jgi:hypothetical protein
MNTASVANSAHFVLVENASFNDSTSAPIDSADQLDWWKMVVVIVLALLPPTVMVISKFSRSLK